MLWRITQIDQIRLNACEPYTKRVPRACHWKPEEYGRKKKRGVLIILKYLTSFRKIRQDGPRYQRLGKLQKNFNLWVNLKKTQSNQKKRSRLHAKRWKKIQKIWLQFRKSVKSETCIEYSIIYEWRSADNIIKTWLRTPQKETSSHQTQQLQNSLKKQKHDQQNYRYHNKNPRFFSIEEPNNRILTKGKVNIRVNFLNQQTERILSWRGRNRRYIHHEIGKQRNDESHLPKLVQKIKWKPLSTNAQITHKIRFLSPLKFTRNYTIIFSTNA